MSSHNRRALCLALALVSVLALRVLTQSGGESLPILPPPVATLADRTSELAGTWQGELVYPHRAGYFGHADLRIRFTRYGTVELTRGPTDDGEGIRPISDTFRGEYRVLGDGVVMSFDAGVGSSTLQGIVFVGDTLSSTISGAGRLNGGVSLNKR